MSCKIVKESSRELVEEYSRSFDWIDSPGSGFSFPSDKDGKVDIRKLNPGAVKNFMDCVNGKLNVRDCGVMDYSRTIFVPAEARCECGRTVILDRDYGHGIDCDCGRIYNMSGQELAPRSQWEERWDEDSVVPYSHEFGTYVP